MKEAIDWKQDTQPSEKIKRYFPNLKRQGATFQFMTEIRKLFDEEWGKPERKANVQNRFLELYPFNTPDAAFWESPLGVDASLQHLARQVSLPLQDSTTFRDPMDRHTDTDLKKIYLTAGAACRPAIALTSISRALKVWVTNAETALKSDVETARIISAMEELNTKTDPPGLGVVDSARNSVAGHASQPQRLDPDNLGCLSPGLGHSLPRQMGSRQME